MAEHPSSGAPTGNVPGEAGLWFLIVGDLIVFTVFFATVLYYRHEAPSIFLSSAATLDRGFGLANTILLLTSSLVAALGVQRYRQARKSIALRLLIGSAALGWLFVAVKLWEYSEKLSIGIHPATNIFYTLYFALTGIHLLHVLIGEAVLSVMILKCFADGRGAMAFIEGGACFWHMVDLLWVILFTLFYIVA